MSRAARRLHCFMPCWWDVMLEQKKGSDPFSQAELWNFTPGTRQGFVWRVLNPLGTDYKTLPPLCQVYCPGTSRIGASGKRLNPLVKSTKQEGEHVLGWAVGCGSHLQPKPAALGPSCPWQWTARGQSWAAASQNRTVPRLLKLGTACSRHREGSGGPCPCLRCPRDSTEGRAVLAAPWDKDVPAGA